MSKSETNTEQSGYGVDIGRRQLLKGVSGLAFILCAGDVLAMNPLTDKENVQQSVLSSPWVHIDITGKITIYNPVAEMGQGSSTTLPLIVAEELDADWDQVVIENSPIDASIYGHASIAGHMMMLTVGSYAVRSYFTKLRVAGASIRQQLLHNASQYLQVPVNELDARKSVVFHDRSGRSVSYADIAKFATLDPTLSPPKENELKPASDFSLIGKVDVPRRDIPYKVDGSAVYSIDIDIPELHYAVIQRAPVNGCVPNSFNREEVESLPGVKAVVPIEYGVGIVGDSYWAVMKARRKLRVGWSKGVLAETFQSSSIFDEYGTIVSDVNAKAITVHKAGNPEQSQGNDFKSEVALYKTDFVYHAQMEPLNAVARVSKDKNFVELWAGTQFASGLKDAVAKMMNIPVDNVTLHQQYLGGGFGRRSWHDYSIEAVTLSLATNLPIKLIWSREDDVRNGAYRPATLQRMQASLDTDGNPQAWWHRTVGDNPMLLAGGAKIPHYNINNQHIDFTVVPSGLRTKHWRAVAYGQNKFAIESFVDELAASANKDSYSFRRELLKGDPRALNVLDEAVAMSPWGDALPAGRSLGLAFSENVGSLTAMVVEISLLSQESKIKVHHVWVALDAGVIVQPNNTIRQTEGAIIQGLGSTLMESITIKNGAVEQSNFHDYRLMKMADVPEITVKLVESDRAPGGVGEAALPITAPAVGNAFARLTGKRLRHLPFVPERIREVLTS